VAVNYINKVADRHSQLSSDKTCDVQIMLHVSALFKAIIRPGSKIHKKVTTNYLYEVTLVFTVWLVILIIRIYIVLIL
jgi:hypothetical protein